MAKAKTSISRRSMFSSALAAGAALAIPTAAIAQTETFDDKAIEMAQRPLQIMGRALVDSRVDVKFSKSKPLKSVFTIRLEGNEGMEFMGAMLAGTVFAGLYTAEEIITKLEKNRDRKTA